MKKNSFMARLASVSKVVPLLLGREAENRAMVHDTRFDLYSPLQVQADGSPGGAAGTEEPRTDETEEEQERAKNKREAGEPPREAPPKHLPRPTRR